MTRPVALLSIVLAVTFAVAIAVSSARQPTTAPSNQASDLVGRPAPEFVAKTLDGREVDLSKEKGNVVLMDFWATWCPPCLASLPHVDAMSKDPELAAKGLKVWAVNCLKLGKETEQRARDYITEKGLSLPVPLDAEGLTTKNFGIRTIPVTLVIGRDGIIRNHFTNVLGEENERKIRQAVEEALRQ